MIAVAPRPRVVRALPGRIRIHLPAWRGENGSALEAYLRQLDGVRRVRTNPLTRNVLVEFDAAITDESRLLGTLRQLPLDVLTTGDEEPTAPSSPRGGRMVRARLRVAGLDTDPGLAARVVEHLERQHPGVRATASPLTGRVLVEFAEGAATVEALRAEVARLGSPASAPESGPGTPDGEPLSPSAVRVAGAGAGLAILAARQIAGVQAPLLAGVAAPVAAGALGLAEAWPAVRGGLRAHGGERTDLLLSAAGVAALTLSGGTLGLAVGGVAALRTLDAVLERRAEWRRYQERLEHATLAAGTALQVESGERTPVAARVVEGTGTAVGGDGLPAPIAPGDEVRAGAKLFGGPFVLRVTGASPHPPRRGEPPADLPCERYVRTLGPVALAYAALTALLTRSPARAFAALLLVHPRAATAGVEAAVSGASTRAIRGGATVGPGGASRLRRPSVLLLDRPSLLTDGWELARVHPLGEMADAELRSLAADVAAGAGSPWGNAFHGTGSGAGAVGTFDGHAATASLSGVGYTLRPPAAGEPLPSGAGTPAPGEHALLLEREGVPVAVLVLHPRLARGTAELGEVCLRHGVELAVRSDGDSAAAEAAARRAGATLIHDASAARVRELRARGAVVAFVAEDGEAADAFAAADLAIGLTDRHTAFPWPVDLLVSDLGALAAAVEAGARRDAAVRDAVALSIAANAFGAVWGLRRGADPRHASVPSHAATAAALLAGWARLRGGERAGSVTAHVADPHPERWGRRSPAEALLALGTTEAGLTHAQALDRRSIARPPTEHGKLLPALLDQVRSPLTGILAAGAGVSLFMGAPADAVMIAAMLIANAVVGVWQEYRTDQAAEALEKMGTGVARVLRGGQVATVAADEIVPGDVLLLARGDHVVADARLLGARGLEVEEALLTGESRPVPKAADGGTDASRVVLEGSDVVVGTGTAVVVAVGRQTRMGATAAALAMDEARRVTPLSARLNRMLQQVLPVAGAGGAIVAISGILRREPAVPQIALGASIAIAAIPEGLTLLAALGEAAVARRLAARNAVVRRPSAVEALGRVDVVCTDKTGTLTEGRLALGLVADADAEVRLPGPLPPHLGEVLLAAALAGPHPDASDALADPTDAVVARAAEAAGFGAKLRLVREAQSPFQSSRSFHAARTGGRVRVEGAAEALVPRCDRVRRGGRDEPLDEAGRLALLARARTFAESGMRVLMVAEGPAESAVDDPRALVALGFLGISDPLRPGVAAAVSRCQAAGVHVIMLTGDHPATARAIAREAGLLRPDGAVVTGADLIRLDAEALDVALEGATVIARATPMDKLRIVESLQRRGYTVAMTGDGVNDAPALRLADVGVAMGRTGTEVARQAADVVLADDDFATLVETFVEGRGFWRNIRRALGLLLGGNLGELGLEVGASVLGLASPLTSHQILAMNLMTDVLPALAVVLQKPEHRDLAALAREGTSALDAPLRNEIFSRSAATAAPALIAYIVSLRAGGIAYARTVAFTSIITTQLAQTLDAGWAEGTLTPAIRRVVFGSSAALWGILTFPPLRGFLGLARLTVPGYGLVGLGTVVAVLLGRVLPSPPRRLEIGPRAAFPSLA
ncbi:MAG TPA: HAD-IC family P-type ATPase [Longimicrobium sp.]|nr:HAD-IC family P-type ATPase [Longimicrobium sp.]